MLCEKPLGKGKGRNRTHKDPLALSPLALCLWPPPCDTQAHILLLHSPAGFLHRLSCSPASGDPFYHGRQSSDFLAVHAEVTALWLQFISRLPSTHAVAALGVGMQAAGSALLVFSIMVQMPNTRVTLHVSLGFSEAKLLHVKQEHSHDA